MKTIKTITFILAFCAISVASYGQSKIAIVDLRKVFDDYYKTKTADATLKDRAGDLDKERKALVDQGQKLTDEYKKAFDGANDQAVASEERDKRKKAAESKLLEIKELEQNLAQFDRQSRTTLEEQQRRMRENILGEIRNVITMKAKTGNYSLVIDTAAETINKTPVVMFTNGENDITAAVLAQLNLTAPSTTGAREK